MPIETFVIAQSKTPVRDVFSHRLGASNYKCVSSRMPASEFGDPGATISGFAKWLFDSKDVLPRPMAQGDIVAVIGAEMTVLLMYVVEGSKIDHDLDKTMRRFVIPGPGKRLLVLVGNADDEFDVYLKGGKAAR